MYFQVADFCILLKKNPLFYRNCQKHDIWAWDAEFQELVLVIPSVLTMLGDNPMQSEFACHIGFRGRFFCRVCWVKGEPEVEQDDDAASDAPSASTSSTGSQSAKQKKKTKKKDESVADMISCITQFMSVSEILISNCSSKLKLHSDF
jgi:hypothetical protein